jgi:hypothetical protein
MTSDPAAPEEGLESVAAIEQVDERSPWAWPAMAFGVVYSWIVGGIPSFTLAANIAVFSTGFVVLVIAFARPPVRKPRGRPVTGRAVMWWALALGGFTAIELINLFLGSTHPHPTWSVLVAPVLENHLAKSVAVFIWLRVGWVLLHR